MKTVWSGDGRVTVTIEEGDRLGEAGETYSGLPIQETFDVSELGQTNWSDGELAAFALGRFAGRTGAVSIAGHVVTKE